MKNILISTLIITLLYSCSGKNSKDESKKTDVNISLNDLFNHKVDSAKVVYIITMYSGGKLIANYKADNYSSNARGNYVSFEYKDSTIEWNGDFMVKKLNKR